MNKGLQLVMGGEYPASNSQLKEDLESLSTHQNLELHKILLSKSEEIMKGMIIEGTIPSRLRKDAINHLKALKRLGEETSKSSSRTLKLIK